MHELSIAQALLDGIEAAAKPHGTVRVAAAKIRLGALSGVEPDLLRRAFEVARLTRPATTQTELSVEVSDIVVACSVCGLEGPGAAGDLRCRHCGSPRTTLRSGDELLLLNVALDVTAAGRDLEESNHV